MMKGLSRKKIFLVLKFKRNFDLQSILNQRKKSLFAAICWIKLTFIVSCSQLKDDMIVPSEDHIHNLSMIQQMF